MVATHGRKPWSKFITPENTHLVSPEAIDLLVSDKQDSDEVLRVTGAAGGFGQGVHAGRWLKYIAAPKPPAQLHCFSFHKKVAASTSFFLRLSARPKGRVFWRADCNSADCHLAEQLQATSAGDVNSFAFPPVCRTRCCDTTTRSA